MIKSTTGKHAANLMTGKTAKGFPADLVERARKQLAKLNAATSLADLRVPPSNCLEALKGDRKGQNSIRINDQWRVCFIWDGTDAYRVEICDYH